MFLNRSRTVRPVSIWLVLLFKPPRHVLVQCLACGRRVVRRPEPPHCTDYHAQHDCKAPPVYLYPSRYSSGFLLPLGRKINLHESFCELVVIRILTHALGSKATMGGALLGADTQRHCCDRLGMLCLTNRNSGHTQSITAISRLGLVGLCGPDWRLANDGLLTLHCSLLPCVLDPRVSAFPSPTVCRSAAGLFPEAIFSLRRAGGSPAHETPPPPTFPRRALAPPVLISLLLIANAQ